MIAAVPDKNVVISSQAMLIGDNHPGLFLERLAIIADVFAELQEVRVIAFTRAPSAWIPSFYQQMIKLGWFTRDFASFQKRWREALVGPLAFDEVDSLFRRKLGDDRFLYIPSEVFRATPAVGLDWITAFSGIELRIDPGKRLDANPSISPDKLETIRLLHRFKDVYLRSANSAANSKSTQIDAAIRTFVAAAFEGRDHRHHRIDEILARAVAPPRPVKLSPDPALLASVRPLMDRTLRQPFYDRFSDLYGR